MDLSGGPFLLRIFMERRDSDGRKETEAYGAEEAGRKSGKKLNTKEPVSEKGMSDCPKWQHPERVKQTSVPYNTWEKQGHLFSTEGNREH